MNILMFSNTYTPLVGGIEKSVQNYTHDFRERGHRVIVVTPTFDGMPDDEFDVIRVPAVQNFNGTDFSVNLPVPGVLSGVLKSFSPDIIHAHHPYLLGSTALRVAAQYHVPLVFTYHTFFERYTHYVPFDSPEMKRFVSALATGYANLCNRVIAPSESVALELQRRGVNKSINIIPSGIDTALFSQGDREGFRNRMGLGPDDYVIGFVSRITPEKNVFFLADAIGDVLKSRTNMKFCIVGDGPSRERMIEMFAQKGLADSVVAAGILGGQDLVDAYHAMDVFAFASTTETQGMVISEAFAAGVPVVAVDAPGITDVVENGKNGILVDENTEMFAAAIREILNNDGSLRKSMSRKAKMRARHFDRDVSAEKMLTLYGTVLSARERYSPENEEPWKDMLRLIKAEWNILSNIGEAASLAFRENKQNAQTAVD